MLKPLFSSLFLSCFFAICHAEPPSNQPSSVSQPNMEKMAHDMQELQKMSDSMQRINALFSTCKMQSDCILSGLRDMNAKEKDPVAKIMLEEFEKQQQITMQSFEACFEQEKLEVMTAISLCVKNSSVPMPHQCIESTLLSLIEKGNTFAGMTLIQFYKEQNNPRKAGEWEQKLSSSQNWNNESLKKCFEDKK